MCRLSFKKSTFLHNSSASVLLSDSHNSEVTPPPMPLPRNPLATHTVPVLTEASLSKRANSSLSVMTSSCAVHCDARLVKPSMSANRMLQAGWGRSLEEGGGGRGGGGGEKNKERWGGSGLGCRQTQVNPGCVWVERPQPLLEPPADVSPALAGQRGSRCHFWPAGLCMQTTGGTAILLSCFGAIDGAVGATSQFAWPFYSVIGPFESRL